METENGRCKHHWLLSDPEYVWQEGQYMELTHQICLHCHTKRDNLCPLVAEVWTDELTMGLVLLGIEKRWVQ